MSFNADPFISKTPGFPKDGITFYDISPILEDATALRQSMAALSDLARPMRPDIIAGVDARGFLFALPLALSMECGMVMVRKAGKLPGELIEHSYALEYGEARLSIQASRQLRDRRHAGCGGAACRLMWRHPCRCRLRYRTDRTERAAAP